ncbi:hypothetical protein SAMN04488030_0441 [Aliiroseovarius halocynthiae]|uniref:Uncharacterized protein n=1 Tax=Aliiroseovarius halocynthiae TaxID=985055 RepID=A0A545STZ9_9RHOB|nr:hypothetical protein [Aliiroseovarius halocynthiae]TQV68434.1 hypothetical protein FIL88_02245 [Aliiroseovarius halocynthiae]SMR70828.1 hypothetical protein SAMN04488030_0441 [Aliiroseovarius halocynthiae]
MSEGSKPGNDLSDEEVVDRVRDDAVNEIDQIGRTLPSLKGQLVKWAVRSVIAYGLAHAILAWRGGPEWLLPVTYLYIGISLVLLLVIWWISCRMIEKSRRAVDQKAEDLRATLDQLDADDGH